MKNNCLQWLIAMLLLAPLVSPAQLQYSTVKIDAPRGIAERNKLLALLEIDHYYYEGNGLIAEISTAEIKKLKKSGIKFEILVEDVAKNLEKQNAVYYAAKQKDPAAGAGSRIAMEQACKTVGSIITTPAAFTVQPGFGGYYSYAQMVTAMDNLAAGYPGIVQKFSLGKSVENRDIWCIKISDNAVIDETDEPEVLYTALQHAREAISGSSMIFFMQYLAENYAGDIKIKNLVDNRQLYVVPCVNPDGWEYNRLTNPNGGGGQRKNRRNTGAEPKGVDLNRNYGVDWGNCAGASSACGSGSVTSDTYWGTAAFSEPETQAIRNLVLSRRFVASIDQHAYGPYYSLPFGRPSLHTMPAPDKSFYTYVPAILGQYNGMRAGNSLESVGYEVAGGIKDWLLIGDIGTGTKGKIYGMTGEGGAGGGTSGTYGSFWAPASQIISLSKGMCFQNLQLAFAAGSYIDFQDKNDISLSSLTGSLGFKIQRTGLADAPVNISLLPIQNISTTDSAVTISSLPNYYDTASGFISYTLPASISSGQVVKFAWKIETGGYTYFDTVTKFYNPVQLLYDDMEGSIATNWTISPTTGTNTWAFTNATAYAGTKSMTESPAGNYTSNTTRMATYKNTYSLSGATAAWLSFWVKHRAENFRDKLQVQVSTNNKTWVPVCGTTTIQEPGTLDGSTINGSPSLTGIRENWTRELFDLGAYLGNTAMRLRFVFTSDGDASGFAYEVDNGFNIDNVKLIKSSTVLGNQARSFIQLSGQFQDANAIRLNWEAFTTEEHDHFEVERSADGIHFATIAKVTANPPFSFVDKAPLAGNNYARIKQVYRNGSFVYSEIINLNYTARLQIMVYPNPFGQELKASLQTPKTGVYTFELVDANGKTVQVKKESVTGGTTISMNTGSLPAGIYILLMKDQQGNVINRTKTVKQ
jgi:carboxypeptidase T